MLIQRRSQDASPTPDLTRFADDRVASGRYGTASEVIRAGLRLPERMECRPGPCGVAAARPARRAPA